MAGSSYASISRRSLLSSGGGTSAVLNSALKRPGSSEASTTPRGSPLKRPGSSVASTAPRFARPKEGVLQPHAVGNLALAAYSIGTSQTQGSDISETVLHSSPWPEVGTASASQKTNERASTLYSTPSRQVPIHGMLSSLTLSSRSDLVPSEPQPEAQQSSKRSSWAPSSRSGSRTCRGVRNNTRYECSNTSSASHPWLSPKAGSSASNSTTSYRALSARASRSSCTASSMQHSSKSKERCESRLSTVSSARALSSSRTSSVTYEHAVEDDDARSLERRKATPRNLRVGPRPAQTATICEISTPRSDAVPYLEQSYTKQFEEAAGKRSWEQTQRCKQLPTASIARPKSAGAPTNRPAGDQPVSDARGKPLLMRRAADWHKSDGVYNAIQPGEYDISNIRDNIESGRGDVQTRSWPHARSVIKNIIFNSEQDHETKLADVVNADRGVAFARAAGVAAGVASARTPRGLETNLEQQQYISRQMVKPSEIYPKQTHDPNITHHDTDKLFQFEERSIKVPPHRQVRIDQILFGYSVQEALGCVKSNYMKEATEGAAGVSSGYLNKSEFRRNGAMVAEKDLDTRSTGSLRSVRSSASRRALSLDSCRSRRASLVVAPWERQEIENPHLHLSFLR